jgi:AraC-like DNA-binding protein
MGRACNLLAEPELSVLQISREVGYASAPQFIRAFKSSVGTTPMEYRETVVIGAEA